MRSCWFRKVTSDNPIWNSLRIARLGCDSCARKPISYGHCSGARFASRDRQNCCWHLAGVFHRELITVVASLAQSSTLMLEQGPQTPSPAPDLIPAEESNMTPSWTGAFVPITGCLNGGVQPTSNRKCANQDCLSQRVHLIEVCRKCAICFEPIRAKSSLFNTTSKVLPCGRFVGKSLKRLVSAEGIEPSTYWLRVLVERQVNTLAQFG